MAVARLTFGGSVDRDAGITAVRPSTMRELTNMLPLRGKARARLGMQLQSTLPAQGGHACTSVIMMEPIISQQESIAVGWYETPRELHVYRCSGLGTNPVHVGLWATLAAGAVPKVIAAENFDTILLAHDEPLVSRRAPTMVYSVFTGTLTQLVGDFDAAGEAPIRFRGVYQWGDYMAGWGFGSVLENHPEYLRLCLPGQPTVFDPTHYFIAGARGAPITSVREAGGNLLVGKASRTYRVVGRTPLNFGILPLYTLIGMVSHRLSITVEGQCYFRSLESFYVTTGGEAPDIGRVLDLRGPLPSDLPTPAALDDGFAVYRPHVRAIEWIFGAMSFVLMIDQDEGLKWAFGKRAVAAACGNLLFSGGTALDDPISQPPTSFSTYDSVTAGATQATLSLAHTNSDGNETGEVWLRPLGGAWSLWTQFAVGASPQDVVVQDLDPAIEYTVAVRHRRGGVYTSGYTDEDPGAWPASSRTTFTTQLLAPTLDAVTWARTSATTERARVEFTPADPGVQHQILRDSVVVATTAAGIAAADVTSITGETTHAFTVRAVLGVHQSAESNVINRWMGPATPPQGPTFTDLTTSEFCTGDDTNHQVDWTMGISGAETEVHVAGVLAATAAADDVQENVCANTGTPDFDQIAVRHKVTTFGVSDFSELAVAIST